MATVRWNADAKNAFSLYVKLSTLLGMWPLLRVDLGVRIRMAIGVTLMMTMMGSTLHEIFENCGDAEDSLNSILLLSASVNNLSKLTMYHVHRNDLSINIVSAIDDWSSIETINYRRVMTYYKRVYKRITFVVITSAYWCTILYALKEFFLAPDKTIKMTNNYETKENVSEFVLKKRYLFPSACTLNDVSETLYPVLVLNQFVQLTTCCIIAVGSDAFFLAITTHLCGQFEILKMRFSSVNFDERPSVSTTRRQEMRILIARHQHLLLLIKRLESAYNKIVLTQMLMSMILISIAGFGFLINLKTGDFFGAAKSLGVALFLLLQSFMYTCIGEVLQNYGNDITQSVYTASWYNLPAHVSKDLVFVMMRSNESPHLTAGKFFHMTYATFMNLVKTSIRFLSVLRIMLNE